MKKIYKFTVSKIKDEVADVVSIFFRIPSDFIYQAGDCVDIGLSTDLQYKTFSFASSPLEKEVYITYKKGISPYKKQLQALQVGDVVTVVHFGSNFTFKEGEKSIFIAGGVGITPLRSMIATAILKNTLNRALLVYLNGSDDYIFKMEFLNWSSKHSGFKTFFINSKKEGRFTRKMLLNIAPEIASLSFNFYISGPPLMIDSSVQVIEELGLLDHIIHTDSFDGYAQELE